MRNRITDPLLNDPKDRHIKVEFESANRAIDRTARSIANQINKLLDRAGGDWEWVARDYLIENLFMQLLDEHDLIAHLDNMAVPGIATIKLSNALLDYRDSRFEDR